MPWKDLTDGNVVYHRDESLREQLRNPRQHVKMGDEGSGHVTLST